MMSRDLPQSRLRSAGPRAAEPENRDLEADARVGLQTSIFEATRGAKGLPLEEILQRLRAAFATRGVKAPPLTWLEAVASSAVYGEPYIIGFPSAIAADELVPAPNKEVRERIEDRRELHAEAPPSGTFPNPAEWNLPGGGSAGEDSPSLNSPMLPRAVIRGALIGAALAAGTWIAIVLGGKGSDQGVQGR